MVKGLGMRKLHRMNRAAQALNDHRQEILSLAERYQLTGVKVFGSVARGSDDDASDLDLLVDAPEGVSLLSHGGFLMDVRDLLGVPVDVTTVKMLKPRIRDRVLREAVML